MGLKFTKRQWLTLIVMGLADFCNAICVSLQAPFFPAEAEKKGATATEYGLVFGVFELVVFLISPIYGQYLNRIGPKVSDITLNDLRSICVCWLCLYIIKFIIIFRYYSMVVYSQRVFQQFFLDC